MSDQYNVSPEEWILAMLYAGGGRVKGKTRIQKGVFLINQEIKSVSTPEFYPYDYGPYSPELDNALKTLADKGLVKISYVPGGDESPAVLIELTDKGRIEADKVWNKLKNIPEFERIKLRLEFASKAPLTTLLSYIYGMYQDYIIASKIKNKVRKWNR